MVCVWCVCALDQSDVATPTAAGNVATLTAADNVAVTTGAPIGLILSFPLRHDIPAVECRDCVPCAG